MKYVAFGILLFCPIVTFAQQDEVVRTLADIRATTGERVIVESVKTGITLTRVTVRRGVKQATLAVGEPELENWTLEAENLVRTKVEVGRDETATNYGPKLGMDDHTFVQFSRVTDRNGVMILFSISDVDDRIVLVAGLSPAQALGVIAALRRASRLTNGLTVSDRAIVRQAAKSDEAQQPIPSVTTRCLAAARLQARAHDEAFGGYSALQDSARDANYAIICKSMPELLLPELRK